MGRSSRGQYLIYIAVFIGFLLIYLHFQGIEEGFDTPKGGPKGIILELIGGLGNQLYIYSAGKMIQRALGVPIYLKLADAPINSTVAHSDTDYRPIFFSEFKAVDGSDPIFRDKIDVRVENRFWDPWTPATIPLTTEQYIYIPNQWYQHVPSIESVIPEVREKILTVLEGMYTTKVEPDAGFIHVRRGDYLQNSLDNDYYTAAFKHLKDPSLKVLYVFSDDIAWCKEQAWDTPQRIIYIDEPDEMKSLYMMSQCKKAAIISNSTFSTWGALLGAAPSGGQVIYPSKWLYGAETAFPSSWIRI